MFSSRQLLILCSVIALAGCGGEADADLSIDEALVSDALGLTSGQRAEGTLSAAGVSWVSHSLVLDTPGELTLTLGWTQARANLNLFFYGPDGALLAYSNSATARPEVLTVTVATKGTYRVGLKAASGTTAYVLDTRFTPAEVRFEGRCAEAGPSWVTHAFEAVAGEALEATLSWPQTAANLNLFLLDPSGGSVAVANGTSSNPEVVRATSAVAGSFTLGVKCKTGASTYTLALRRTAGTQPPPPTVSYPGRPAAGTVYWGAAVQGNADPTNRHELPAGAPLGVHRTFFQWDARTGKMVSTARDDLAKGRLPWVSVKPPSWAAMAAGTHDRAIDEMLTALDALGGPVWLTIHHEPEGGNGVNAPDDPAGPAGHVAMNRRVRERMTALRTTHVALAPILMTYTFKAASGRNPDEWFAPGIYDFIGVDHYRDAEASLVEATWATVRTWVAARKLDVAVGEWGMRGSNAASGARVREWFDQATASGTDGKGARVVALSAFDSSLNSDESWVLAGAQLSTFHQLLTGERAARLP